VLAAGSTAAPLFQNHSQVIHGLPVKITEADPDGPSNPLTSPVTVLGYSAANNLVYQKNPDNSTKTWTYNTSFSQPLTATDELGRVTEMTYDSEGNMTALEDAAGFVWSFTYTAIGLIDTATSPDPDSPGSGASASVTDYDYDSYGRLVELIHPDSSSIEFTYNSADQLLTEEDELGHTKTWVVDKLDRITKRGKRGAGQTGTPSFLRSLLDNRSGIGILSACSCDGGSLGDCSSCFPGVSHGAAGEGGSL
jgi:YD repeat-containing protein